MRRGDRLPPVWLAPGAISDPRALTTYGPVDSVLLPVGPVQVGPVDVGRPGPGAAPTVRVGGIEHALAPGLDVPRALDLIRWCSSRELSCVLAIRGASMGELAEVVHRVRLSLDADAVEAIEVDLRGQDEQAVLRTMARVREAAPRDLMLLTRLSALDPELVALARSAVAGGAGAVVVCGSVRLPSEPAEPQRWWSGPATAPVTLAGVRALTRAADDHRWPGIPLVAAGGVHDPGSARAAFAAGAQAVQLGTALWADPTLMWTIRTALSEEQL